MASKYGGSSREPAPAAGNFSSTEKSKRPALLGATATTLVTSAGLMLTSIGNWAASGSWAGIAASSVTGLLAGAANHLTTSYAESRQAKKQAKQAEAAGGGSAGGGPGVSVRDVISAASAATRGVRENGLSALVGIETRLQMAASMAAQLAVGTGHSSPASVQSHIERALSKVTEIRSAGNSAVDQAENWAKGL